MVRQWSVKFAAFVASLLLLGTGLPARAVYTKAHDFTSGFSDGAYPVGARVLSGGSLYGFTQYGFNGYGSFVKQATTGAVTTVKNFDGSSPTVSYPNSGPVAGAAANTLYATCIYGGTINNNGMIFSITTSGVVTELHSFGGGTADGAQPYAGVTYASDGKLYGTTYSGGLHNQGIIYRIDTNGQNFTILHHFDSTVDGNNPFTAVCEGPDGKLYGSLYYATGFNGAVYRINKDGTGYSILGGFTSGGPEGYNPYSDLARGPGASTKLYGTNLNGAAGNLGAIYSVDTSTGTVALAAAFDGYSGAYPGNNFSTSPQSRMTAAASGTLMYGVARNGGPYGYGTIFKLDTATNTLSLVAGLTQQIGNTSATPLTLSGTTLYASGCYGGITATMGSSGSPDGYGSTLSCTTTGTVKLIHSWYVRDGYSPYATPTIPYSGFCYGTVLSGGLYGGGYIYKINSTTNAFTVIHHFNNYVGEGYAPYAGLYRAADGNFYGTTTAGGIFGNGTLFKCSSAGVLTVLHHFRGSYEGNNTFHKLVQGVGTDKYLYGICYQGGPTGYGSVFKCDTAGKSFQVLHFFSVTDGAYPGSQLTVEKDSSTGNTKAIYGGTYLGGANGVGTLFKIVPAASQGAVVFTKLKDLDPATGASIYYGGQMQLIGTDLYGVTYTGGANGHGVIFKLSLANNSYSVVHDINNGSGDGYYPYGGVSSDAAGATLYGTCTYGGTGSYGTAWKYSIAGNTLTVLHNFAGQSVGGDGAYPYGAVWDETSGRMYGTTVNGGTTNEGSFWIQSSTP